MTNYIGTSGYMIPQKLWYEQDILNSLEINSIFYKIPKHSTIEKWRDISPKNMKFSVKMNRGLTHFKKLSNPKESWNEYWECVKLLESKLGVILFQFPPSFKNTSKIEDIDGKTHFQRLKYLSTFLPEKIKFAFEFRDTSWFTDKVYALLQKNNWALVNDYVNNSYKWMGDIPSGFVPQVWTADFNYIRLHGSVGKFRGSYSTEQLKDLIQILKNSKRKTNYIYFNNSFFKERTESCLIKSKTIKSAAYCDACQMIKLVQ